MKLVNKEDVIAQFKELLPWDKVDALDEILNDIGENSIEDYLFKECGYSPFDFTNASQCVDHYGVDSLLDEMDDYDIESYLDGHPSTISAYQLIETLKDKWNWHKECGISDTNVKELENLLEGIKKYKEEKKNKKQ